MSEPDAVAAKLETLIELQRKQMEGLGIGFQQILEMIESIYRDFGEFNKNWERIHGVY